VAAKLALIDEKIRTEKENIDASRKELSQLDAQVDQTIGRTTDDKGTERAIAIRRGQQKDRARILNDIGQAQAKIAKYNEERAPIASEVRKVEAEVGPIKYIAAMIYDEKADTDVLEKAVRIVTLMIVIVFDPLAVLMLIAANWSLKNNNKPDWTKFFTKKREEVDLEELPDVKEIKIEDDINIGDKPDAWIADVGEKPTEEELKDLDVDIEEPKSEWSPELYKRDRHKMEPSKTKSFLNKIQKTLSGEKTIEKEVEELQDTTKKPVEYDSAGRRITP
jgi:thiamine pyrophosphate-dependent acetolactate synthase large subunit-like protein